MYTQNGFQNSMRQINEEKSKNFITDQQQSLFNNRGIEYGKSIKLLRNGDEYYPGCKLVINSRKYRYFDVFLDDISNILNARFGAVRTIYTPINGHKIKSLEAIENGKTYVAAGPGGFRKLNYLDISEGRKAFHHRLQPLRIQPTVNLTGKLFEQNTSISIYVYRNGDVLTPPLKVLFHRNTLRDFDAVLNELTSRLQLHNGPVLRLHTMQGDLISSSEQLINGNSYVATSKERFKKCEYFPPEEFGISPRLLRKAKITNKLNSYNDISNQNQDWRAIPADRNSKRVPLGPLYSKPQRGDDLQGDENRRYRATSNRDPKEIPDSDDVIVDLPVELQQANEIENDELEARRLNAISMRRNMKDKSMKQNSQKPNQNSKIAINRKQTDSSNQIKNATSLTKLPSQQDDTKLPPLLKSSKAEESKTSESNLKKDNSEDESKDNPNDLNENQLAVTSPTLAQDYSDKNDRNAEQNNENYNENTNDESNMNNNYANENLNDNLNAQTKQENENEKNENAEENHELEKSTLNYDDEDYEKQNNAAKTIQTAYKKHKNNSIKTDD